jgi:transcriptional regulator GlxA family with amidase domain
LYLIPAGPILESLPPMLTVNVRTDRAGHWLEQSILHLAEEAASDRAGSEAMLAKLVDRFTRYLSEPPMAYLTGWRLRLAAEALTSTPKGVADIAADVGYDSEAAFNRAFKRVFGVPPARYRRNTRDPVASPGS